MHSTLILTIIYAVIGACYSAPASTTCQYNGKNYSTGQTFKDIDGCNTCSCTTSGFVACTEIACINSFCSYNGKTYQNGQGFKSQDGCNSCGCSGGMVVCTQRACMNFCSYEGKVYLEGQNFQSSDGCNSCGCSKGQVVCTRRPCPLIDHGGQ